MIYNPDNQYRCSIIRGKSQSDMEDLLPLYAKMVNDICPCNKDLFQQYSFSLLSKALFQNSDFNTLPEGNKKTVRNHFTEIAGKLLGLYYIDCEGYVEKTEVCSFLLENNDYPAFFKNLCLRFQFPNGTKKESAITKEIENKIRFKPYCFVIALLYYAQLQEEKILLTKQEIGYYVLNNLDVLRGNVSFQDVYEQIVKDRKARRKKPQLSGSYDWQHIKEQFNMLELTNMIQQDRDYIWLNKDEEKSIKIFIKHLEEPYFEISKYNLFDQTDKKQMYSDWAKYYSTLNAELASIATDFTSTSDIADKSDLVMQRGAVGLSTVELGDKGEAFVYNLERERVYNYKPRLVNKVLLLGKTKGLGYDISSIEADENPTKPEFARYIEVKSTKRITEPSFDRTWMDSLDITSKEWVAAEQYGEYYNIYRVYFTKNKTIVVRIKNPFQKSKDGQIEVYPTTYKMNFDAKVIEKRYAQ